MVDVSEVDKILSDALKKYKVPKSCRDSISNAIFQIFNNPARAKYGAYVMTREASVSADKKNGKGPTPVGF